MTNPSQTKKNKVTNQRYKVNRNQPRLSQGFDSLLSMTNLCGFELSANIVMPLIKPIVCQLLPVFQLHAHLLANLPV